MRCWKNGASRSFLPSVCLLSSVSFRSSTSFRFSRARPSLKKRSELAGGEVLLLKCAMLRGPLRPAAAGYFMVEARSSVAMYGIRSGQMLDPSGCTTQHKALLSYRWLVSYRRVSIISSYPTHHPQRLAEPLHPSLITTRSTSNSDSYSSPPPAPPNPATPSTPDTPTPSSAPHTSPTHPSRPATSAATRSRSHSTRPCA